MRTPKPIQRAIEAFERLPGIGPKTAARLVYFLLPFPEARIQDFADALVGLKRDVRLCSTCYSVGLTDPCEICSDRNRDQSVICVVEQPLDVVAMEKTGKYHGLYHVLHGVISPLQHIGPDELRVNELMRRIQDSRLTIQEIVLALNPTMEGEATSLYIKNLIQKSGVVPPAKPMATHGKSQNYGDSGGLVDDNNGTIKQLNSEPLKLTILAQGLPLGGDLEYADGVTLGRALEGRREF